MRKTVTRRRLLRTGVTGVAAVSGTAAALRPMLAAPAGDVRAGDASAGDTRAAGPGPVLFDEVYRGRRIQGYGAAAAPGVTVLIDGRPLHVMRRVDGSWLSLADHYQPYPTPLATARGAVDVIGQAELATPVLALALAPHQH